MTMLVWLIRHAAAGSGESDPGLSPLGVIQARRLADRLAERPLVAMWSSDSRRALETAALIALPHRLEVRTTPALRELDFGEWEGRSLGDLWSQDPEAAKAWEKDIRRTPQGFGENVDELEARVRSFWSGLRIAGEVVVVAHGGSLAALRSLITGESFESCFAARIAIGGCDSLELVPS